MGEGDLADKLTAVAAEHPAVSIGSYPNTGQGYDQYKVKLALSSRDEAALAKATEAVRAALVDVFDTLQPVA
jgi:molybdopterin-biosynthesis enzyme MoeA-like protein